MYIFCDMFFSRSGCFIKTKPWLVVSVNKWRGGPAHEVGDEATSGAANTEIVRNLTTNMYM